ncbi:MAG: LysR substrate-binding domain-containing protein [Paracoccaceae bacterium]|nr:LysR substrate-binding domain-containing protein [Paracoccaceae bacterium]
MKITFRQVDAFRTVVSTGTMTEAAEMLAISQPAVSRLISDLEKEVGFQLFKRLGRVLVPTEEARLLVQEVRQAVSGMEHIKQSAAVIGSFGHARLNLVTNPSFSAQLVPDLITKFCYSRPKSMIHMEIQANDDIVEWMVSQQYDFGISTNEPSNPSFESLVIKKNDVYCIVPKNHRLNEKTLIHARDLAEENFISYMPESKFRFEVDQFFEAKKIKRCMQYETRTTDAICSLVGRDLGVSIIGSSEAYLNTIPECIALPFAAPISFRAFLFWSKNKPLSAIAETFLNIAKASINID